MATQHDNVQLFMRFKMEFEENGSTENQYSKILNGQKLCVLVDGKMNSHFQRSINVYVFISMQTH